MEYFNIERNACRTIGDNISRIGVVISLLNAVHHVAIIVSDYEKSRKFYVEQLELLIIRENYRSERRDYKLDLQLGNIELEIFGVKNSPKRVTNPEACGLRHLAFRVENIEDTVKWLNTKGIETEPIMWKRWYYSKRKYVKLLEIRHFEQHMHFSKSDKKSKKKAISSGVNVIVVLKL